MSKTKRAMMRGEFPGPTCWSCGANLMQRKTPSEPSALDIGLALRYLRNERKRLQSLTSEESVARHNLESIAGGLLDVERLLKNAGGHE